MVGQAKKIPYECLINVLRPLRICFTIATNTLECLRILTNAVANLTNVLRIKQQHDTCVAYLHIHIADLSFCFLFARLFPISLFPIILILTVRILSLYYENINTNASESLQTSHVHYKCVAIDQNGLRTASWDTVHISPRTSF